MKPRPENPYFRRTLDALVLAAPFCMAPRYETLSHCIEASVAGAAALRRRRIVARPIPCALRGMNTDQSRELAVGLDARAIYDGMEWQGAAPTFEEWRPTVLGNVSTGPAYHMIIEAHFRERALIDLTLGQLRRDHGVGAPMSLVAVGEGWPAFGVGGWTLAYQDSHHAGGAAEALTLAYDARGFTGDLTALMDMALAVDLDLDRFIEALLRAAPVSTRAALARIADWSQKERALSKGSAGDILEYDPWIDADLTDGERAQLDQVEYDELIPF